MGDEPEHPRAPAGLPDRRGRHAGLAAHVQRGRRVHDHLRRSVAACTAIRFPGPLARWRRRRLADRLLRAPSVFLSDRSAVRRLGSAGRPGLSARHRRRADAAAPDRGSRAEDRSRPYEARLALVARIQLDQFDAVRRPAAVRPAEHMPVRLQRGSQGLDRPDPLAEGDRPRRAARDRGARAPDRDGRAWPATGATWIDRDGGEHFEPAKVVVLAGNAIGTPRLLLLSASPSIRTASPIRPVSSASG